MNTLEFNGLDGTNPLHVLAALGAFVLTDPKEWFWGWKKWGRLLFETLMMAYLGIPSSPFPFIATSTTSILV